MILSLFAQLGHNMWWNDYDKVNFDEDAWTHILDAAEKNGINQIILDIGEGIKYYCYPELSRSGAWSHDRVRAEVERCRNKGIELVPKLNFSATHHLWLGEYGRMMSTRKYYDVCRDLIKEVASLFEGVEYFHLGMDEEGDPQFFKNLPMVHYRQPELLMHDLKYLIDCVKECGKKAMIWGDPCVYHPELFRKYIPYDDVALNPWIYFAIRREHWTPVKSKQRYIKSTEGMLGVEYMEEAPIWQTMTKEGVKGCNDGYKTMPCCSIWGECEYCTDDVVEHFYNNCNPDNLLGFMTAPWLSTLNANEEGIIKSIELLSEAKKKFCTK